VSRRKAGNDAQSVVLLPDAGPLITLAYADALDLLFKPGWAVQIVDMVLHEVTRHTTPTNKRLAQWARRHRLPVLTTRTFEHHRAQASGSAAPARKSNLGELAVQEVMNGFALSTPPTRGVFLFEDHKIARVSFLLPESCQKVSTRAFLLFLEQAGLIASAAEVQARALRAGRAFSQLRFPPE
jgi:hypothetical protein